jgi:hypothetical protein
MAWSDPAELGRHDPLAGPHPQSIYVKLCLVIVHSARLRSVAAIRLFFRRAVLVEFRFRQCR